MAYLALIPIAVFLAWIIARWTRRRALLKTGDYSPRVYNGFKRGALLGVALLLAVLAAGALRIALAADNSLSVADPVILLAVVALTPFAWLVVVLSFGLVGHLMAYSAPPLLECEWGWKVLKNNRMKAHIKPKRERQAAREAFFAGKQVRANQEANTQAA